MKAFVTGASEGLGRAFAIRLAKEGYRVTAVARNEGRLAELLEELDGGPHEILPADLSERKGVDRCAEKLRDGSFRLLVNNAGCSRFGSYAEAEIDDELRIFAVNCEAAMILAHAFLEVAESGDALINLSSLTYVLPTPIQPTYVATKTFLASFSESLWYQARSRGVYVQGLCPGLTRTQFLQRAGLKRYIGLLEFLSMTPEQVVDSSLRAMQRRRGPIVIPGFGSALIAILCRLLPRRLLVALIGRAGEFAHEDS
jgi:short-subunit dehydrogenase